MQPGLRVLVVQPHLVFYEVSPDDERPVAVVEIVRVLDGRRDLSRLF
jgi:toxin ParE1/3/4